MKMAIKPSHCATTLERSRSHLRLRTQGRTSKSSGFSSAASGDQGTRPLCKNPFQAGSAAGCSNASIGIRRSSVQFGSTCISQLSLLMVIETAWSDPSPGEANRRSIRALILAGISDPNSCFTPGTARNSASAHMPIGPFMAWSYVRRDRWTTSPPRRTSPRPLSAVSSPPCTMLSTIWSNTAHPRSSSNSRMSEKFFSIHLPSVCRSS